MVVKLLFIVYISINTIIAPVWFIFFNLAHFCVCSSLIWSSGKAQLLAP